MPWPHLPLPVQVKPRTLLLAGQNDFVIPSAAEARRLPAAMPRCRARVLPGRSHALLQEEGVDLVRLLQVRVGDGVGAAVWVRAVWVRAVWVWVRVGGEGEAS